MSDDRAACYLHVCGKYVLLTCDYQGDSEVGLTGWGCTVDRGLNAALLVEELELELDEVCQCKIGRDEERVIIEKVCWDLGQRRDW